MQKKCLIVSGGAHAFLLFVVLVGAAFFVPEKEQPPPTQPLKMIPSQLIDSALAGGGPKEDVPQTQEKVKGDTYKPQPKKKEPEPKKIEPKKVEPKKVEPKKKKAEAKPKPKPPKSKPKPRNRMADLKRRASKPAEQKSTRLQDQLKEQARSLRAGFAKGTAVKVSGTGGAAYSSYASLVKARYDDAWEISVGSIGASSVAKVRVVIARSGKVTSAKIIRPSGDKALDASVQRALNAVTKIAPFPKHMKEASKAFIINFDVNGKQGIG